MHEYLMQARERDIKRRVAQASGRPFARDLQRSKSDHSTRESR
jgi:hypothetical protein